MFDSGLDHSAKCESTLSEKIAVNKPLAGKKVAVLLETEYIAAEIEYYQREFSQLGAEVELLSYLWGAKSRQLVCDIDSPERPVKDIHTLVVDVDVADREANNYDIVVMAANYCSVRLREIPPMGSLGSPDLLATPPAVDFFAKAMLNKKIVKGALCHALWILTPIPALLKGRKVICHTVVLADVHNAGAIFVPAPEKVVIDDDLITGRSFADVEAYFQALVETAIKKDTNCNLIK